MSLIRTRCATITRVVMPNAMLRLWTLANGYRKFKGYSTVILLRYITSKLREQIISNSITDLSVH